MCDVADNTDTGTLCEGDVDGGGAGAEFGVRDADGERAGRGTAEEGGMKG